MRRALAADPWNPRLAALTVSTYLDLGWTDLASEELDRWLFRFPGEAAACFELRARLKETSKASEARGEARSAARGAVKAR